ncbi:MAG: hypothetical protein GX638_06205 [Crenarchaeota archaeon]|nr:hypothetical protein [Thermoproteota archaeon]
MSYCIAWKDKTSVFITADTAVTADRDPQSKYSSFGELHEQHKGLVVEESLLKIAAYDSFIIGYAGEVKLATEFIFHIKLYNGDSDLIKTVKDLVSSYNNPTTISLVIGYIRNDEPILFSYNANGDCQLIIHDDLVQIGSAPEDLRLIMDFWIKYYVKVKLDSSHMLVCVNAILQNFGLFDNLMRFCIGGVFFGASVNSAGIHWQDDTSFMILTKDAQLNGLITSISRDSALVLSSTFFYDETRVFFNSATEINANDWVYKWKDIIDTYLKSGQSKFYVFFNNKFRTIIVINTNRKTVNKYFKLETDNLGRYDFYINPNLINEIMNPPAANIRFKFLNG